MNTALGAKNFIIRFHRLRIGRKETDVKGAIAFIQVNATFRKVNF